MPKGIYDRSKANVKPPKNKKFHQSKEWLENEYLVKQKSTTEIGRELGLFAVTINYWLRKYNIPIRDVFDPICRKKMSETTIRIHTKYHISRDELQKEFIENRKTINQLSIQFDCSWDTIRKKLIKYGFPMRKKDGEESIVEGKRRTSSETRNFNKKIVRLYGYRCAICKYDKFVVAHHIQRWSKTQNNEIENGICLCPNHHAEADYGIISEKELRFYQITNK